MIETQFSTKIKTLRSDGGGEYTSSAFKSYLLQHGVIHQASCPYTPQQNGLVERKHKHLIETTITLLSQASMFTDYLSYALLTAVFLINQLPTSVLSFASPWSKLHSTPLDLSQLKVFGCAWYPLLRPYSSHKLDPRIKECLFLSYSHRSKGYLCLDATSQQIYTSKHVLFNESRFPFTTHSSSVSPSPSSIPNMFNALWLSNFLYLHASNHPSFLGPYSSHTNPSPLATSLPHSPFVDRPPTGTNHTSTDHTIPSSPSPTSTNHISTDHTIVYAPVFNSSSLTTTSISHLPHNSAPFTDSTHSTVSMTNQHPMQTRSKSKIVKANSRLCYKAIWITTLQNLLLIKWLPNIQCGVKLWMQNFKPYKGNRLGHWFQHLLMLIW